MNRFYSEPKTGNYWWLAMRRLSTFHQSWLWIQLMTFSLHHRLRYMHLCASPLRWCQWHVKLHILLLAKLYIWLIPTASLQCHRADKGSILPIKSWYSECEDTSQSSGVSYPAGSVSDLTYRLVSYKICLLQDRALYSDNQLTGSKCELCSHKISAKQDGTPSSTPWYICRQI